MEKKNYKLEYRSVKFGDSRVLEYRYAPGQDLSYTQEVSLFWGLIKFKIKRNHSTRWHQPELFNCWGTSHHYEVDNYFNWGPVFLRDISDLRKFQSKYPTKNDWDRYVENYQEKQMQEYLPKRQKYLESFAPIY